MRKIGLQLHTLRDLMKQDIRGTLADVHSLGYREVEFAGYFSCGPAEISTLLKEFGLTAPATHASPDVLMAEPETFLDLACAIGHHYVVLPWWNEPLRTSDGYKQLTELLNRVGKQAQERGLKLAYHNHAFEFDRGHGQAPYDFLLTQTNPDHVYFELDVYWAAVSKRDPLQLMQQHPGRIHLLHLKDMDQSGRMVDVGEGLIDFASIFAGAGRAGVQHVFVEHDNPEQPMQSATKSLTHILGTME